MLRVYGLAEIQRVVDNASRRGYEAAEAGREYSPPSAEDILDEIGIKHPMNRSFKLGQAPSWAKE